MNKKHIFWPIFFKIITVLLFALIIFFVCYDFFDTSTKHFSTEIIIALVIEVVVASLDSFDSFQIGNLLKMKKEKDIIKKENDSLREQNIILTKTVANINNNVSINFANVNPAGKDEIREKEVKENFEHSTQNKNQTGKYTTERDCLNKYLQRKNCINATIIREAKINTNQKLNDDAIFDLYIKDDKGEEFIDVRRSVPSFYDCTYVSKQLSLVSYYNKINHSKAKFVLILINKFLEGSNKTAENNREKLKQMMEIFKTEINDGLMSIEQL